MTSSFFTLNLGQYLHDASQMGLAEFCADHPDPLLLVDAFVPEEEAHLITATGGEAGGQVPFVLPIRGRREGTHGYGNRITLGRTGNNDLVLKSTDVSKIHGFFSQAEGKTSYTDAHSSYGSKVNGEVCRPGVAVALESGAVLGLASLRATYFTAEGLYAYLNSLS